MKEQDEIRRLRLDELRPEIRKGTESLAVGDTLTFSDSEDLAAHVEAGGRKLLADRLKSK